MVAIVARPVVIDTPIGTETGLFGDELDTAAPRTIRPAQICCRKCPGRWKSVHGLDHHRRFSSTSFTAPRHVRSCAQSVAFPRRHRETVMAVDNPAVRRGYTIVNNYNFSDQAD
jgi:hypothetical protein